MCSCGSERIAEISAKCSDCCSWMGPQGIVDHQGYVPNNVGIGGGDYIEFDYCLDCGRIQTLAFPVPDEALEDIKSGKA